MAQNLMGLGQRLVDAGYITPQQLDAAIALQKTEDGLLGDILVRHGYLSAYDLSQFLYSSKFTRVGELLLEEGLITRAQLSEALAEQRELGGRVGDICVRKGFLQARQVEEALARHRREKPMLGEILVEKKLITRAQLDAALAMQQRSGGRLGEILVYLGYLDEAALCRELASQVELGRVGTQVELDEVKALPYELAQRCAATVIREWENGYDVAVREKLDGARLAELEAFLGKPVTQVLLTEGEQQTFWEQLYRKTQVHSSILGLYDEQPQNSAIVTFTSEQLAVLLAVGILLLVSFFINWRGTLFGINIFFQILYALMTVGKLAIVLKGERNDTQLRYTKRQLAAIDERELPVYTVLVPVYKEKEVVKKLLKNIGALDYPQYKLDVRILLEEDDAETIDVIRSMELPSNFTAVIVPKSQPQTKPKACNYGLLQAKGDYVVIYDAEDRPEPDQLKKAYLAFKNLPEDYVCIQAKLNYFNSKHNVLTKLFTQEYSMWFELLLVGIMQMDIPIPLGGTSNHFKMSFLKQVGGWDPFNVTEDADLGIRLYKFRYKTAILDSRTWEEANANVFNWIRQRSRWIKGYMQTWLVHMRHPVEFYKTVGLRGFIGYQAMILGTPLLPLINPVFWVMVVLWYTTHAGWIQGMFPGALYYVATVQFILGNFVFMYMNIIGMYHVIRDCALKKAQPFSYGLIKYALFTPVYWLLMSIAAYKAFFQLVSKPFYWEKTQHGLTGDEAEDVHAASP